VLTHHAWERFGAEAAGLRERYDIGWDTVLERLEGFVHP
jgi:hypothetical protein